MKTKAIPFTADAACDRLVDAIHFTPAQTAALNLALAEYDSGYIIAIYSATTGAFEGYVSPELTSSTLAIAATQEMEWLFHTEEDARAEMQEIRTRWPEHTFRVEEEGGDE